MFMITYITQTLKPQFFSRKIVIWELEMLAGLLTFLF